MRTFGIDEPMGCYDDIEAADAFVLWGSNMAEMHPILWTRVTDRRLSATRTCKVAVLSTFEHRCFDLADIPIVVHAADRPGDPQLHRPPHHQDRPRSTRTSSTSTRSSAAATTDIGYGLRPEHPLEKAADERQGPPAARPPMTFEEFAKFVDDLRRSTTPPSCRGVPESRLEALAELYADPKVKVMSFWTMGFNQHTRGVWANNMVYNMHLLTGKIADAGQQPVLADRPALGLRHRARGRHLLAPPAGRHGGDQPRAPRARRGDLEAAARHHPRRSRATTRSQQNRDAQGRQAQRLLGAGATTTCRPAPNMSEEGYPGYRNPDNFIVVSDAYPTVTALAADLILPTAMWVEKEGAYGNAERRTQFWHQLVDAPGEARSDLWQLVEFSKRFTVEEVWPAELLAKKPE